MKYRSPVTVFLLSIVTLGIYDIYWLAVTKRDLNSSTRQHIPSIWLLFAPIAALVIVALVQIIAHSTTTTGPAIAAVNIFSILFGILAFLAVFPITFYWYFKYAKAANEYTNGHSSTRAAFLLLWLLLFIGVPILQDYYNDIIDGKVRANPTTPTQPPPTAPISNMPITPPEVMPPPPPLQPDQKDQA